MARTRANPEQHTDAYNLYQEGLGQTAIAQKLVELFPSPVSERTVGNWIRGFKRLNPILLALDSPFQWHRAEEYDLPWEASAYLLEMWRMVMNGEVIQFNERGDRAPTVRQAKWWWRIHQAVPDVSSKGDVWFLAQRFVNREMLIQVLDEPLEFADLEAHLAYKPWENEDRIEAYRTAVQEGRIAELRRDDPVSIMLATSREDAFFAAIEAETSMFWFLPSQQRAQRERNEGVTNGDS